MLMMGCGELTRSSCIEGINGGGVSYASQDSFTTDMRGGCSGLRTAMVEG